MYLLYEHHKDASGNLLATDMLMSSFFPGRPGIAFKKPAEAAFFEFTKHIFKAVHASQRSYDPDTKIWSFFAPAGAGVYKALKDSPMAKIGLLFEKIESLADAVRSGYIGLPPKGTFSFDAADFFYTPEAPKATGPTKDEASDKLALILGISSTDLKAGNDLELKKLYRRAALRLHPDRNNGDASAMTDLNYLWQVYNA